MYTCMYSTVDWEIFVCRKYVKACLMAEDPDENFGILIIIYKYNRSLTFGG